jgi:hypothetical protein
VFYSLYLNEVKRKEFSGGIFGDVIMPLFGYNAMPESCKLANSYVLNALGVAVGSLKMSFGGMLLPLMSEIKYRNYRNMVTVHGSLHLACI